TRRPPIVSFDEDHADASSKRRCVADRARGPPVMIAPAVISLVRRHFSFVVFFVLAVGTPSAYAQTETGAEKLSTLIPTLSRPHGLCVDSDVLTLDGTTTHSAHFNSAFQSDIRRLNIAIASQLSGLPLPSPASGFTYRFDEGTGTFVRSTQSFGPILTERAETI